MYDLKTIVVSDLHLGNPYSNWIILKKFLEEFSCERLFLNGNIIDDVYLKENNKNLTNEEFDYRKGRLDNQKEIELSILSNFSRRLFKRGLKVVSNYKRKIKTYVEKNNVDGIICGHIHKPEIINLGKYHYLNSGDWIENNTALVQTKNGD